MRKKEIEKRFKAIEWNIKSLRENDLVREVKILNDQIHRQAEFNDSRNQERIHEENILRLLSYALASKLGYEIKKIPSSFTPETYQISRKKKERN